MKNLSEKLAAYNDALSPLLEELRAAFIKVINQNLALMNLLKQ